MKLEQDLNFQLTLIAEEADDQQAVDQLLLLVSESGAVSVEEGGVMHCPPLPALPMCRTMGLELKEGVNKGLYFDFLGARNIHMINYILCSDQEQDVARFGRSPHHTLYTTTKFYFLILLVKLWFNC